MSFHCKNCGARKGDSEKVPLPHCTLAAGHDWQEEATPPKHEAVHHPAHYGGGDNPYEAIKVIDAWGSASVLETRSSTSRGPVRRTQRRSLRIYAKVYGICDIGSSNWKKEVEVKVEQKGTWREVADAARTTVGMGEGTGEPSLSWKKRMLLSEHSPIRKLVFNWKWLSLKSWVSVHLVRHKFGIDHFVRTQRSDRTGVDRDTIPQGALVDHEAIANAQAVIYISRKRLCQQASPETRQAWEDVVSGLESTNPELASVCVPECVYRGFCPEFKPCGYTNTATYTNEVARYRRTEFPK